MPIDLEALAAEVAELREIVSRPRKRKDRRAMLCFRADPDELAAIDAAARSRGLCRADLIRLGLNAVCGMEMRISRDIPPGLVGRRNRKRLTHFSDEKTSVPLRDRVIDRHEAGRQALRLGLAARALMAEAGAAISVQEPRGVIGEPPSPLLSGGKLSR